MLVTRHQFVALSEEYISFVDAQDEEIALHRDITIYDMNGCTPIVADNHEKLQVVICKLEGG